MRGRLVITCIAAAVAVACLVAARAGRQSPGLRETELTVGLARLYSSEGMHEEAIRLCRELMRTTGNASYARLGLAGALFAAGDFSEAEEHYRNMLREDPDAPVVMYNLAHTLNRQGKAGEADTLFHRFRELYGDVLPGLTEKATRMTEEAGRPSVSE